MRHSDSMMLIGSCFSDNIGAKLHDAMIDVTVNPFGTIFNPLSIASAINKIIDDEVIAGAELFMANGVWNCFDFHSRFSMANTVGLTLPRLLSKSVACTWITSGLPLICLANTPAG